MKSCFSSFCEENYKPVEQFNGVPEIVNSHWPRLETTAQDPIIMKEGLSTRAGGMLDASHLGYFTLK